MVGKTQPATLLSREVNMPHETFKTPLFSPTICRAESRSRRTTAKTLSLFGLTLVLACAHNPYMNRMITDEHNVTKKYFIAYGRYCGPGWPPDPPPAKSRTTQLLEAGMPIDDLDSICYAHDY